MTSASDNTPRMTAETVGLSIVQDEEIANAAAALRALSDDDLRQRVRGFVADYDAEDGSHWARTEFDADNMSRDEMIRLLSDDAGGCPPTFAIPADADDPLGASSSGATASGLGTRCCRHGQINGPHRRGGRAAPRCCPGDGA
jgi:hypothetical protein